MEYRSKGVSAQLKCTSINLLWPATHSRLKPLLQGITFWATTTFSRRNHGLPVFDGLQDPLDRVLRPEAGTIREDVPPRENQNQIKLREDDRELTAEPGTGKGYAVFPLVSTAAPGRKLSPTVSSFECPPPVAWLAT